MQNSIPLEKIILVFMKMMFINIKLVETVLKKILCIQTNNLNAIALGGQIKDLKPKTDNLNKIKES